MGGGDAGTRSWEGDAELLDALPQAAVTVDCSGVVVHANEAAARLLSGHPGSRAAPDVAEEVRPGSRLAEELFDDVTLGAFEDVLSVVRAGGSWTGELGVTPRHGAHRLTSFSVRPVRQGRRVVGALVLLAPAAPASPVRTHLSERLTRLARVASELVLADSVETVTKIVVEHMADAAGATVASLSLLVDDDTLRSSGCEGVARGWSSAGRRTPWTTRRRPGRRCARGGWWCSAASGRSMRATPTSRPPPRATGRSPVCRCASGTAASGWPRCPTRAAGWSAPAELEFLAVMVDTCAQAIERVRVAAEAADRSDKIRFLADSSVELSSSLDYEATLAKVARLAVPWFADWCSIALDQDGELRTLAVAHVEDRKVLLAEELHRRYPPDPSLRPGQLPGAAHRPERARPRDHRRDAGGRRRRRRAPAAAARAQPPQRA